MHLIAFRVFRRTHRVPSDKCCLDVVSALCCCLKTPRDRGLVADACCVCCCGECVACSV